MVEFQTAVRLLVRDSKTLDGPILTLNLADRTDESNTDPAVVSAKQAEPPSRSE